MSAKVSKYRHVFPTVAKPDQLYTQIKNSSTIWDLSSFLAASSTHVAVAWAAGGGGKLAVLPLVPGKINDPPCLTGHSGPILDWGFHPFNENLIATASEDCTVRLWTIPEDGMKESISNASITLTGHGKKVGILRFNHTANHVLFSAGMDNLIKQWDLEKGERASLDVMKDQIMSLDTNLDASLFVTTCRDKKVRIIDPRANTVVGEGAGHQGAKSQKALWAKRKDKIITTGFSKTQERQIYLFDPRKMDEKYHEVELDNASGVMMMFYDEDTNMLYLGGKGDGNIRYFELWDNEPPLAPLSDLSTSTPQRGLCMLPKWAVDTSVCEVAKFLKLENDRIVPISFQCPRKQAAQEFQSDVYPETFSTTPALSADEYFGGKNDPPLTMSLQGLSAKSPTGKSAGGAAAFSPTSQKPVSASEVETQRAKVEKLRAELAKEEEVLALLEGKAAPAAAPAAPAAAPAAAEAAE
jgi:coronin-1B/1C/6